MTLSAARGHRQVERCRSLTVAVAALAVSCAGGQRPPARGVRSAADEILRAAALIEKNHVVAVDAGDLVRTATKALDAAAGEGGAADVPDRARALEDGIARLRVARPDVDDARAIAIAVSAMAASLNDGSRFLTREEFQTKFRPPSPGRGGVGLVVKSGAQYPVVVRVLPGAPAAGVFAPGDELRAVDGRTTAGLPLKPAMDMLVGPLGSRAALTLGRPGEASRIVDVTRADIDTALVDCRILDGTILYLGVRELGARTAERVRRFASAPEDPPRLVVLDLRGNTGGPLDAATNLADVFLESGPILTIDGFRGSVHDTKVAKAGTSPLERARIAVVVDAETGSGAEAVAAAIQDGRRGVVVGSPTSAKAAIDVLYELGAAGVLRLTAARLLRASGEPIDGRGVTPDLVVDPRVAGSAGKLSDVACPGFASPGPVAQDAAVARAAAFLLSR